jgi:hypothetical protein
MPLLSTLSKKPLSSLGRILFQSLGIVYRGLIDNPNSGGLSSVLDRFGQDTAVYGQYAFIGAKTEDSAGNTTDNNDDAGVVYIYDLSDRSLIKTLINPNADTTSLDDWFGSPIAAYGNYLAVGAQREHVSGQDNSGYLYIYETSNGTWNDTSLQYSISNPDAGANDLWPYSLAMYDEYIVTGGMLLNSGGKVHIYDATDGSLRATITNPNPYGSSTGDNFGNNVDIYPSSSGIYWIAISAPGENDSASGYADAGVIYIYKFTASTNSTTLVSTIAPSSGTTLSVGTGGMKLGSRILAVGDKEISSNSGAVYLYRTGTGQWDDTYLWKTIQNPNAYDTPDADFFSSELKGIALAGNTLAIAARQEDDSDAPLESYGINSGKVYLYDLRRLSDDPSPITTIDNLNHRDTSGGDFFGSVVSTNEDGSRLIISANEEAEDGSTGSGIVYTYTIT